MKRVREICGWFLNGCMPTQHNEARDRNKNQRQKLDDADGVREAVGKARVEGEEKNCHCVAGDRNAFLFPGSGCVSVDAEKVL